jgi:hypothetical protein
MPKEPTPGNPDRRHFPMAMKCNVSIRRYTNCLRA